MNIINSIILTNSKVLLFKKANKLISVPQKMENAIVLQEMFIMEEVTTES